MMQPFTTQQQRVRYYVLATWTLLFVLVCVRQLQQALTLKQLGWALLFSLPLLITLPGLLQGKRYTHTWATLCVLPYFVIGITEAVANNLLRNWALLLLGASLLWFFALLAFLRVTPASDVGAQ
jgi:uncharacterized membrane protein